MIEPLLRYADVWTLNKWQNKESSVHQQEWEFKKMSTPIFYNNFMATQYFHGKKITYLRRFVEKNFDGSSNCKKLWGYWLLANVTRSINGKSQDHMHFLWWNDLAISCFVKKSLIHIVKRQSQTGQIKWQCLLCY